MKDPSSRRLKNKDFFLDVADGMRLKEAEVTKWLDKCIEELKVNPTWAISALKHIRQICSVYPSLKQVRLLRDSNSWNAKIFLRFIVHMTSSHSTSHPPTQIMRFLKLLILKLTCHNCGKIEYSATPPPPQLK